MRRMTLAFVGSGWQLLIGAALVCLGAACMRRPEARVLPTAEATIVSGIVATVFSFVLLFVHRWRTCLAAYEVAVWALILWLVFCGIESLLLVHDPQSVREFVLGRWEELSDTLQLHCSDAECDASNSTTCVQACQEALLGNIDAYLRNSLNLTIGGGVMLFVWSVYAMLLSGLGWINHHRPSSSLAWSSHFSRCTGVLLVSLALGSSVALAVNGVLFVRGYTTGDERIDHNPAVQFVGMAPVALGALTAVLSIASGCGLLSASSESVSAVTYRRKLGLWARVLQLLLLLWLGHGVILWRIVFGSSASSRQNYTLRFAADGRLDPAAQQEWCTAALPPAPASGDTNTAEEGAVARDQACAEVAFSRAQRLSEATGAITLLCALAMLGVVVAVRRLLTGTGSKTLEDAEQDDTGEGHRVIATPTATARPGYGGSSRLTALNRDSEVETFPLAASSAGLGGMLVNMGSDVSVVEIDRNPV